MIKLHHLRDFIAIANAQSVRGAARDLGLAQPALTRSLRELEETLGTQVLHRHARGVSLTAEGQRFLLRARAAVEELRLGHEEARQQAGQMEGQVTAALSSAAMLQLLPPAYSEFRQACPWVRLWLMEGSFPMFEGRLREGSVDFFVGPRPERFDRTAFRLELLFQNQRMVVARPGHPLARADSLRQLVGADWLLTGLRGRYQFELEEQFNVHDLPLPRLVTRVDSMLGMLTLLTSTDALAMLPRQCVESPMFAEAIVQVPVKETLIGPDIVIIRRAGLPLTPAADRFLEALRRGA